MSGSFQAFELDELEKQRAEANTSYFEFMRRRGMSVGLYSLPVGTEDRQHPHTADEMYLVLRGRATLRVGDRDQPVREGTVVSVDHGEDHRFVDIAEDLQMLVVFAPPESDPED
jgi:mannose-6-phosphate isomerase-like protein (cupin superfamily)